MKIVSGLILFFVFSLCMVYMVFFSNNISQKTFDLKLTESTKFESVLDSFAKHDLIRSMWTLQLARNLISVNTVPTGYYKFNYGEGNKTILQRLKRGTQEPINFTLSTATYLEDIASRAGNKMKFDSAAFLTFIYADSNQRKMNYNAANALCLFLPNTHQVYWTASISSFVNRFYTDYNKFWNEDRRQKAMSLGLEPNEVYILASLVQKEYTKPEERSKIAGVLINRLHKNMPLQVDASCKYATKDFEAKRVLAYHTSFVSPFNTYLHVGLPPGPICVPEKSTIDAVLNPDAHHFLFYCADPSLNGYHVFSKTYMEHETIASQYHRKMNELKIK